MTYRSGRFWGENAEVNMAYPKKAPDWLLRVASDLEAGVARELAGSESPLAAIRNASERGTLVRAATGQWYCLYRMPESTGGRSYRLTILLRIFRGAPSAKPTAIYAAVMTLPDRRQCELTLAGIENYEKDELPVLLQALHPNVRRSFKGMPRKRFNACVLTFNVSISDSVTII
jgi:hypothetical protein